MKNISIFTATIILVPFAGISAAVINIPDDYSTIQAGIDAAGNNDTVLVQPGIYTESIVFDETDITLGSLYLTTGDTSYAYSTVIQSDGQRVAVMRLEDGSNHSTRIIGLTIRGGRDGGIRCVNSSPTIAHNRIIGNSSYRDGAGIYLENCSLEIVSNTFEGNIAGYLTGLGNGGGIFCHDNSTANINSNFFSGNEAFGGAGISVSDFSRADISHNIFVGNHADIGGAVFVHSRSEVYLSYNTIRDNTVDWYGGGMFINLSSVDIEYDLITGNYADKLGGACLFESSTIIMSNLTICDNTAADSGGGIWYSNSSSRMTNSIQWGNSAYKYDEIYLRGGEVIIGYTDIAINLDTLGNINTDPLFIDPAHDDYHLRVGSPCIDSGDPDASLDPDGTRRDMGAFCFDRLLDLDSDEQLPMSISLEQNYPNPFNAITVISYSLDKPSLAKIEIYDILGRRLQTITDGDTEAGAYSVTFNASSLTSGVYIYRLTVGQYSLAKKMVFCK
jgi:hypothetical protein